MGFAFKTLLVEPEIHSILFILVNVMMFIYVMLFVVPSQHIIFYLITHFSIFVLINRCLAAGRSFTSKKNLNKQTVVVTGAAGGTGRVTALQLAKLQAHVIIGVRRDGAKR